MPEQESVEDPDPTTLVGDREQVSPLLGETEAVRVIDPAKPCREVGVIVEIPDAPAVTVTIVGFAANVKS